MDPLLDRARKLVAEEREPEQRLRDLLGLWVAHVVAHRDHMLVFQQQRHVIEHGTQWRSVRASRKAFEQLVADVLSALPADLGPAAKPRLALFALLGMVNHTAQWYRPHGSLTPEEITEGYVALLLDGAVSRVGSG
jgi:TetR/AcrR family transcriptional regulator, cholesterol catabolism regulator